MSLRSRFPGAGLGFIAIGAAGNAWRSSPLAAQRALGLAEFLHSGPLVPIVICWCQGRVGVTWLALRASALCSAEGRLGRQPFYEERAGKGQQSRAFCSSCTVSLAALERISCCYEDHERACARVGSP